MDEDHKCLECAYSEPQCPPVILCKLKGRFSYLSCPACEDFKPCEEKKETEG